MGKGARDAPSLCRSVARSLADDRGDPCAVEVEGAEFEDHHGFVRQFGRGGGEFLRKVADHGLPVWQGGLVEPVFELLQDDPAGSQAIVVGHTGAFHGNGARSSHGGGRFASTGKAPA